MHYLRIWESSRSSCSQSSHQRCSIKKLFLKTLLYSQESTCVGVSFYESCRPWGNFIAKSLQHKIFKNSSFYETPLVASSVYRVKYLKNLIKVSWVSTCHNYWKTILEDLLWLFLYSEGYVIFINNLKLNLA